jgi:hypothetical protein
MYFVEQYICSVCLFLCLTPRPLGSCALPNALNNVILVNRLPPTPANCWSGGRRREHSWTRHRCRRQSDRGCYYLQNVSVRISGSSRSKTKIESETRVGVIRLQCVVVEH